MRARSHKWQDEVSILLSTQAKWYCICAGLLAAWRIGAEAGGHDHNVEMKYTRSGLVAVIFNPSEPVRTLVTLSQYEL